MLSAPLLHAYRESAAWFPLPGRTAIEVTGRDRATFLHNFCTNDIKKLQPGQGCEACFCNAKGRVIGHGTIFAEAAALWIDTVPGAAEKLLAHLDRYLIREDVVLRDATADVATTYLAGPQALEPLLAYISPLGIHEEVAQRLRQTASSLPINGHARIWPLPDATDVELTVHLRCVDWLGERGYLMTSPPSDTQLGLGGELIELQGVPSGRPTDWEALRIAAGWPMYGVDLTEEHLPQEVARNERCISFTKGCYLGQEPIARLDALGHTNRELRRLKLDGDQIPLPGTTLHDVTTGDLVGNVTSASAAPFDTGGVALGYLKTKWTKPGTVIGVGQATPLQTAIVAEM